MIGILRGYLRQVDYY